MKHFRLSQEIKKKAHPYRYTVSAQRTFLTADLSAPALHRLRHRAGCNISKRYFLFCLRCTIAKRLLLEKHEKRHQMRAE